MIQRTIFDPPPTTQQRELTRVLGRIGECVVQFITDHAGKQFHMSDLHAFVQQQTQCAPGSPDRVFRELRRQGLIRVELVSRSASLYQVRS